MPADDTRVTRRRFGATVGGAFAATVFGDACVVSTKAPSSDGHLSARPGDRVATSLMSGPLGLGGDRDGLIQVPAVLPNGAAPLLLFLHGATQNGAGMLRRIGAAADQAGIIVLAPDSRDTTWDAIRDGFGADVEYLNRALAYVFDHAAIDPARVVIGGFSDGASYAISLGLANGDLFSRVVAFSPGFVVSAPPHGHPSSSCRTACRIGSCRSTSAAASSCRGSRRWATTSPSGSSRAGTKCRPLSSARG
jgi:poly(3-hydroxybutyrate) depolymerase